MKVLLWIAAEHKYDTGENNQKVELYPTVVV